MPLRREDFLAQLDTRSPREFAKWYDAAHGGTILPEILWEAVYEPHEAAPMRRVADECLEMGVEVVLDCSLEALRALSRRRSVVILAAHWRSGLLQLRDIVDVPGFLRRLRTGRDGVLASLRARLQEGVAGEPHRGALDVQDEADLVRLVRDIQRVMAAGPLDPDESRHREAASFASDYLARNGKALRDACLTELGPGAGLELDDATHPPDVVAAAFDDRFEGLIDLAVCNSYLLAESIKRRNPNCLIMANLESTAPTARLLIAREVLRSVHAAPRSYVTTALAIRDALRARTVRT